MLTHPGDIDMLGIGVAARKRVVVFGNMAVKGVPCVNPEGYLDQKRKLGLVKRIRKQIDEFGLTLETN